MGNKILVPCVILCHISHKHTTHLGYNVLVVKNQKFLGDRADCRMYYLTPKLESYSSKNTYFDNNKKETKWATSQLLIFFIQKNM